MRKWIMILLTLCLIWPFSGCSDNGSIHMKLLPEDADLSLAPDVIVEPKKAPYNLGGWLAGNTVFWEVELPEDASYEFEITYSRPSEYPEARGILRLETADGQTRDLNFSAAPTGKSNKKGDWSAYITRDGIGSNLRAGAARISLIPNYEPGADMPDHYINLRAITITGTPKPFPPEVIQPDEEATATTQGAENEQPGSGQAYRIMIDGENVTVDMALTVQDDVLYARADSYCDAMTFNKQPILYYEYEENDGEACIYSWATDVKIMHFPIGATTGYRLVDNLNDEWEEIVLDEPVGVDSAGDVLLPVKAMTDYLISLGTLDASVEE